MIKRFHIIKKSYLRLFVWAVLLVGAWILFFMNARFSEEFTGGVKITVAGVLDEAKVSDSINTYLEGQWFTDNRISLEKATTETTISIVTSIKTDEKVAELSKDVQQLLVEGKYITGPEQILQQSITGPSVGSYMKSTAIKALIIGLILMAIYMMFAFATIRKEVSPSVLAVVTVISMIFDISIPAGAYGFLMMINPTVTVDTIFIIAILTNMGYSINDTIIIFDRVRENMQLRGHHKGVLLGQIFEDSLRQTMRRSIGTVLCLLLVIAFMFILGSGVIKDFAFTIGIGTIAGSYSSIFINGPLAYILLGKYKEERKAMLELKD